MKGTVKDMGDLGGAMLIAAGIALGLLVVPTSQTGRHAGGEVIYEDDRPFFDETPRRVETVDVVKMIHGIRQDDRR